MPAATSYGPVKASFSQPAIATDGETFLTAWIETRYGGQRIVVQRLDQASPTSAPKFFADRIGWNVQLVWAGSSYLMVYTSHGELRTVRLDSSGTPLAGTFRYLGTGSAFAVASDGSASLVVAEFGHLVAISLNGNDEVVREEVIGRSAGTLVDAETNESGFAIALSTETGLFLIRMDRSGNRLDPEPRLIMSAEVPSAGAYRPWQARLASSGPRTLVIWTSRGAASDSDLFSAIIGPSGEVPPPLPLPHKARYISSVEVVRDGDYFQVLLTGGPGSGEWSTRNDDLETLRLNDDGIPVSQPRLFGPTLPHDYAPSLARNRHGYGVVWESGHQIVGYSGPLLELDTAPLLLSKGVPDQVGPDVAGDGLGYLVAWGEEFTDRQQIVALRVSAQADVIGEPLVLLDVPFSNVSWPRVVYGHGMYLVAWTRSGALWGVRVDSGGRRLDAEPVRLSGSAVTGLGFDVTPSPSGFFVVWSADSDRTEIMGAELTLAGPSIPRALTIPLPVPPGYTWDKSYAQVAFNGEMYLLVYTTQFLKECAFPGFCDVLMQTLMYRLDRNGMPSGQPVPVEGEVLDVVSGNGKFALLQTRWVSLVEPQTLTIFSSTLFYDDDIPFSSALIWNGSSYRLLWSPSSTGRRCDLFERRISSDGTAESPRRIGNVGRDSAFRAATTLAGDLLAVYSLHPREEPFYGAARVVVQQVEGTPEPPPSVRRRSAGRG